MAENGSESGSTSWRTVDCPANVTLHGVVHGANGAYTVGGSGHFIRRGQETWHVVLNDGPNASNSSLYAIDATDDGKRIWFAGGSGALGAYDVDTGRKFDYSYPQQMSTTWTGMAVAGDRGSEKGLVANSSGEILPFAVDGFDPNWGYTTKPGGGSGFKALAASRDAAYAVDNSANVFQTKGGRFAEVGIPKAGVTPYDIYAGGDGIVYVACGSSTGFRYDDSAHNWTPIDFDVNRTMYAVDGRGGKDVAMLDGGGGIHYRVEKNRWASVKTPATNTLYDLSLGSPSIAVGGSGTIVEKQ